MQSREIIANSKQASDELNSQQFKVGAGTIFGHIFMTPSLHRARRNIYILDVSLAHIQANRQVIRQQITKDSLLII